MDSQSPIKTGSAPSSPISPYTSLHSNRPPTTSTSAKYRYSSFHQRTQCWASWTPPSSLSHLIPFSPIKAKENPKFITLLDSEGTNNSCNPFWRTWCGGFYYESSAWSSFPGCYIKISFRIDRDSVQVGERSSRRWTRPWRSRPWLHLCLDLPYAPRPVLHVQRPKRTLITNMKLLKPRGDYLIFWKSFTPIAHFHRLSHLLPCFFPWGGREAHDDAELKKERKYILVNDRWLNWLFYSVVVEYHEYKH